MFDYRLKAFFKDKPFKITSNWNYLSLELMKKYPQLEDSDLKFKNENEEDILKNIGIKLNMRRNDVITIIRKLKQIL